MGITITQPGAAKLAAATGTATSKAARAKEDRARAARKRTEDLRLAQQHMADTARQKAQQVAMEWELQKMQITSQRAFERELRQEDYRLMAEDRSAAWQIEKMELASRMDFERSEGERQRKLSVIDNSEAALNKAIERGEHTEDELAVQNKRTEYKARRQAIELGETYREPRAPTLLEQMEQREAVGGGTAGLGGGDATIDAPPAGPISVRHMEAIAAIGKTYVVRKTTGENVAVPIGNAEKAIETGRFVWPNVVGTSQLKKQFPDIVRQETTRPQGGSFTF